jgi:transposase-like protein
MLTGLLLKKVVIKTQQRVTNFKKVRVFYSDTFKRKVLTSIISGEMSAHGSGLHYGIKGSMTVYRWLDKRDKIFGSTLAETIKVMPKEEEKLPEELKAELLSLRKLLEQERLRSESYLMMIKLAEEKYSIPIEKKFGTKQSK